MILYRAMYDIFFDKTGKTIDEGEIVTLDEIREISGDPDAGGFIPFFEFIDTEDPENPYVKIHKKLHELHIQQLADDYFNIQDDLDDGYDLDVPEGWEV